MTDAHALTRQMLAGCRRECIAQGVPDDEIDRAMAEKLAAVATLVVCAEIDKALRVEAARRALEWINGLPVERGRVN